MLSRRVKARIRMNKHQRAVPAWKRERNNYAHHLREIAKANMMIYANGHFGKSYPTPPDTEPFSIEKYRQLLNERKIETEKAKAFFTMDRHAWRAFKASKTTLLTMIRNEVYETYHSSGHQANASNASQP